MKNESYGFVFHGNIPKTLWLKASKFFGKGVKETLKFVVSHSPNKLQKPHCVYIVI